MWKKNAETFLYIVALIWLSFLSWRVISTRIKPPEGTEPRELSHKDWQALLLDRPPSLGHKDTAFSIVEFSDYQCPFCRLANPQLDAFVTAHARDSSFYMYNLPLDSIHPYALPAAKAAECAALQGVHAQMQSALFEQQKLTDVDWNSMARKSGVPNGEQFAACIASTAPLLIINKDIETAARLKISSTPTLIINGHFFRGPVNQESLEEVYKNGWPSVGLWERVRAFADFRR